MDFLDFIIGLKKHNLLQLINVYVRFKVETQLLSWLQKYDTEMSDKQNELDELIEKYEDEKKKTEDLEVISRCDIYSFKPKTIFQIL